MKEKGFTLIELLAVIVVLAVIALITTPAVLKTINKSKKGAKNDTVDGIIRAIDTYYANNKELTLPLEIKFDSEERITIDQKEIELKLKGDKPNGGSIVMDKNGIIMAVGLTFKDGYICTMTTGEEGCGKAISAKKLVSDMVLDSDERYIYRGVDLPNKLMLKEGNLEVPYLIVSKEKDGSIKVVRQEPYTKSVFDKINVRTTERNSYCQGLTTGCNAWSKVNSIYSNGNKKGTVEDDSTLKGLLNGQFYDQLSSKVKNSIVTHTFNVGGIYIGDSISLAENHEKSNVWSGKIGLLTLSDWFKAATSCTAESQGYYKSSLSNTVDDHATNYLCSANNYLYLSNSYWWVMTSRINDKSGVLYASSRGGVNLNWAYVEMPVRPSFFLSPNIELTGSGTNSDPYKLK